MRFGVWVACMAAGLAGCAGFTISDNVEPPAELTPIDTTLAVERMWSVDVGKAGRARVALAPAVDGEHAFVAGRNGRVVAVTAQSGRPVWQQRLGATLSAGPAVGEGLVVVTATDGGVIALDPETGEVRWRTRVSSEVLAKPAIARGIVAVRTADGQMHGLDALDGGLLWSHDQPTPPLMLRGSGGPVTAGDLVIAGFDNGRLVAMHVRDGQLVWDTPIAVASGRSEIERLVDVNATPRVIGRDLYAVAYQGSLVAMAVDTGRVLWSQELSSSAGLGAGSLAVWVTDQHSELWGFDRLSGGNLWHQPALRARWLTAPTAVGDDAIAVGDLDGWVHFLSQESGEFVARVRAGRDAIQVAPVAFRDLVLVQGSGGTVTAYRVGRQD